MVDYQEIFARTRPGAGDFEQCYAFSIHKAGSTLMHKMIGEVCNAAGIPAISIPDILFKEGLTEKGWESEPQIGALIGPGRVYYGYRYLPQFLVDADPDLRTRPTVLLVRDPRDALVSQYFSFGGKHLSHRLPDKNKEQFIERNSRTADLEIDEYVLQAGRNYLKKMQSYRDALDLDSILMRRYEDIYFDKRGFLGEIFTTFRLPVAADILDSVAARNDIRPDAEQTGKHIRKGAPGDHREKLRPETIARLNDLFHDTCKDYGYDLRD